MEWTQFILFIIAFVGLFTWNRTESRSDSRHLDSMIDAQRNLIREIHKESAEWRDKMAQETKEFHARLCVIEAARK